jgi:hypothetical protein
MDLGYLLKSGGETGIRTLETREGLLVFKTSAFNRSAISPIMGYFRSIYILINDLQRLLTVYRIDVWVLDLVFYSW